MHLAVNFAAKGDVSFLVDWQRIHIGPQRHAGTIPLSERRQHTGFGQWVLVGNPQFIERVAYQLAGPDFLVHQLGMTMQLPTTLDDPVANRVSVFQEWTIVQRISLSKSFQNPLVDVTAPAIPALKLPPTGC
jgi:hypothetical protein